MLRLLQALGSAGNLETDAQIAALAIEHGAVLHTADTDFFRFPGLRPVNPLTGERSAGIAKIRARRNYALTMGRETGLASARQSAK